MITDKTGGIHDGKGSRRQNNDETLAETLLTFSEIEDFQGLTTTYKLLSDELQKSHTACSQGHS